MQDFNRIAPYYDSLSRLVFGNTLRRAWSSFFSSIPEKARILIVGGGTGHILSDLNEQGVQFNIDFVESSEKMIRLSRSKEPFQHLEINYFEGEIQTHPGTNYDVIITPFVLDCFNSEELNSLVLFLRQKLKPGGFWLFTDFVEKNSIRANVFIRVMYLFFRITSGLNNHSLPDYNKAFYSGRMEMTDRKTFYYGMIESRVYHNSA